MRITHRSGKIFILRPVVGDRSPLDVAGVDTVITCQETLDSVRDGREQDSLERQASYKSRR